MVSNKGLKPEFAVKWPGSSKGLLWRAPSAMHPCPKCPPPPALLWVSSCLCPSHPCSWKHRFSHGFRFALLVAQGHPCALQLPHILRQQFVCLGEFETTSPSTSQETTTTWGNATSFPVCRMPHHAWTLNLQCLVNRRKRSEQTGEGAQECQLIPKVPAVILEPQGCCFLWPRV